METSTGASPSAPCVDGVPVVQGYPCLPPAPPPPPPSTSGGATPDQNKCRDRACHLIGLSVMLTIYILLIDFTISVPDDLPIFKLDSVSVSVDNFTAVCDIGFSIDRLVGDHLQVWARFMSRDYKVESNGRARNSTVSISAILPRGGYSFPSGVTLLELVAFKSNSYVTYNERFLVEAVCMDVPVEISTRGLMLNGGPKLCPVVYHQRLY